MSYPVRLELVNVCSHESRVIDIPPGITTICGPNGSGKSNAVGLLLASVTNDFSQTGGHTKETNIYRNKPADAVSYIASTWITDAGEVHVHRDLFGTTSFVSLNGEDQGCNGKEGAVTARAVELLGVSLAVLKGFVIADTEKLLVMSKGTETDRAKMLTTLCGHEALLSLDRDIRDMMTADKAVVARFDPAELDKAYMAYQQRLVEVRKADDQLKDLKEVDTEKLKSLEVDLHELRELRREQQEAIEKRDKAKDRARQHRKKLDVNRPRLARVSRWGPVLRRAAKARQAQVTDLENQVKVFDVLSELHNSREGLQKWLKTAKAPTAPLPKPEFTSEDEEELTSASAEFLNLDAVVTQYKAGDGTRCTACRQPLAYTKEQIADMQLKIEEIRVRGKELKAKRQAAREYDQELRSYEEDLKRYKTKRVETKKQVVQLAAQLEGFDTAVDIKSLRAKVQRYQRQVSYFEDKLETYEEQQRELASLVDRTWAALEQADEEVAEAVGVIGPFKLVAEEEVQEAAEVIESLQTVIDDRKELISDRKTAMAMVKASSREVRRLRAVRREMAALTELLADLAESREVLKRERLPARLTHNMFLKTAAGVNEYLADMQLPFRAIAEPAEFAFTILHADQCRESTVALSTGQKLCLGIAFWLSRATVFESQVPFFVLDEPTANVDATNVLAVADALSALSAKLAAENRRGIVITHHTEVAASVAKQYVL